MSYPNQTDILNAANQFNSAPSFIFAFAAVMGRVPGSQADLNTFVAQVTNEQNASGLRVDYLLGYAAANGSFPMGDRNLALQWGKNNGFVDATGTIIATPYPGYGYPPGGAPVNNPPTSSYSGSGATLGLTTPTGTRPGFLSTLQTDFAGIQTGLQAHEKALLIGGALVAGWYTGLLPSVLRAFRGRRR